MSTGKRLAKRSILGTRVCVPRQASQDGRYYYYPAVIQALKSNGGDRSTGTVYSVIFHDKTTKECAEKEIVGPGFQPVSTVKMLPGQPVFITHNGREVAGTVKSEPLNGEMIISILLNGLVEKVYKRLEDVRLLESRKSARLQDLDQDYSRLADFGPIESRKRPTSSGIDVPLSHGNRKRRPSSSSDGDVLDDCAAAMVLMSLSCSPKSPRIPGYLNEQSGFFSSRSWTEASLTSSSGASSWQSGRSNNRTPSPPYGHSESAPYITNTNVLQDEGIEMDDGLAFFEDPLPRKRRNSTRTAFQCTWPGCKMLATACDLIEKHVRYQHLGRSGSDGAEESDHEEEFYYTEVEVSGDMVIESFDGLHTSSPPTLSHMDMARPPYEDPEYQRLIQNSPLKQNKIATRLLSSSPKPSSLRHRKCRKVYGMENRDMWCTQCKWKKACSRFSDVTLPPV
uniref:DUF4772 domain-containing protein n=1 Tax=Strigamia maritima TaxID=126957 RepID=T1JA62_STRMM